jgi:hypothetical protein
VSRAWLKPFAAGAAVVAFASFATWTYISYTVPAKSIVLLYLQPDAPKLGDPASRSETSAMYVASIGKSCKLKSWKILMDPVVTDTPEASRLIVPFDELEDRHLNCLATFVKPPFVTLKIKSN